MTDEKKEHKKAINRKAQERWRKKQAGDVVESKRPESRYDALWERLKIKHAGKSRLTESIKPPIYLTHAREK